MAENQNIYPADLSIDYPDRPLDKLTTLFRLFTVITLYITATSGPIGQAIQQGSLL
jgi:hypothetical protein